MHDKINTSRGLRGGLGEFAMLTPRWGNVQEILHFEPTLVHRAKKEQLFLHFLYFQGRRCKICENKCILRLRPATDAFGNGHPAVTSGRLNQSVSLALITTV